MSEAFPTSSSNYGVYLTFPPRSLFSDYRRNPPALSPPQSDFTLARPFNISHHVYTNLLHLAWPITIASVYAVSVRYINTINKDRNYKPWAISKTLPFYIFVLAHNIGLAIFSGWVFAGMWNAVRLSWPGWDGEHGLAGAADALCKLHGPRGLGSAATFSTGSETWSFTDHTMKLTGGQPDSSDVGRIWNEGLGFYGFLFYLSKFYEVVDTAIILAKGKKSSQLQTFHHAGAMLCMWAGIRYMSPPIWMFTFINSGLHTLMYLYYTLTALTIRVPLALKRTLTFLQILQILFGASYAVLHIFVAYDIPVYSPVVISRNLSTLIPSGASAISSAASSVATSADIQAWLKKLALRAAGEEGLAENVRNFQGETFGIDAVHAAQVEKAQEEIQYKLTTRRVNCLDTSGEVFAILLNAAYLAPLAGLFISFFFKNYLGRSKSEPPKPTTPENIKQSAIKAVMTIEEKIKQAMEDTQGGTTDPPPELQEFIEESKSRAKQLLEDADESVRTKSTDLGRKVQQDIQDYTEWANRSLNAIIQKIKETSTTVKSETAKTIKNTKQKVEDVTGNAKENIQGINGKPEKNPDPVSTKTNEKAEEIDEKLKETAVANKDAIKARGQAARDESEKTAKDGEAGPEEASKSAKDDIEKEGNDILDALEVEKDTAETKVSEKNE